MTKAPGTESSNEMKRSSTEIRQIKSRKKTHNGFPTNPLMLTLKPCKGRGGGGWGGGSFEYGPVRTEGCKSVFTAGIVAG